MGDFMIGGVSVIVLVLGWVEFAKSLGLQGNWCKVLAVSLGFLFVGVQQAIGAGVVPEVAVVWINIVVNGLGGALATIGLYNFSKQFRSVKK